MPVAEDVPLTAFALELKHALSAIGERPSPSGVRGHRGGARGCAGALAASPPASVSLQFVCDPVCVGAGLSIIGAVRRWGFLLHVEASNRASLGVGGPGCVCPETR